MENIIVGIDFSNCSHNAMEHALSAAVATGSKLTLLYILATDAKIFDDEDQDHSGSLLEKMSKKLEKWADECRRIYPNVEAKVKEAEGKIFREIVAEADTMEDAVIFVGTHGSSGFEERFIGSAAFKIVSNANCPVFTIRESNDINRRLDNMLLLVDSNRETLQKVKLAAQLAKAFNAKVSVLGLQIAGASAEISARVKAFVGRAEEYMVERNIRVDKDFMVVDPKVPEVIFEYAEKHDMNLLVCMKEIELYADRLFVLTSFNKRIVNRSPFPVLTIPVDYTIYNNVRS